MCPDDPKKLIYENPLAGQKDVEDFVLEGDAAVPRELLVPGFNHNSAFVHYSADVCLPWLSMVVRRYRGQNNLHTFSYP